MVEQRRRNWAKELETQHLFRVLVTFWIIATTAAYIAAYIANRNRAQEGQDAHNALCIFKEDLIAREKNLTKFLKENPHGFDGIPASVIEQSRASQRATIESLKVLEC